MIGLYLIKERIESIAGIEITTGRGSEDTTDFGTVKYVPNLSYEQPYVHNDAMRVTIYMESVDGLLEATGAILEDLNQESMGSHPLNDNTDGIKYHDVVARVSNMDEYSLISEQEVPGVSLDILVEYVKE
jgi:hypothetical protein